ncbi:PREDICTED: F-box protein At5g46170-like [Tarenaya hassleriana]|uniref:F-box protein At5g46170-like n=1 Tax=Tarenaya hassleriana TaxID=28532 RepID=UPI00053C9238|nr:PREDICTED: F-box protein At5g46170-like [Tarenaya hassleriana]
MGVFLRSDPPSRIHSEPQGIDHFDRLPDSVVIFVFNKIGHVKALGRCRVVSKRFHSLVSQVDYVVWAAHCDCSAAAAARPFSSIFRRVVGDIVKPLQAVGQFLGTKRSCASPSSSRLCMTQFLKTFKAIRYLRIETPLCKNMELGDGVFLQWRAEFGSTLDKCVIL